MNNHNAHSKIHILDEQTANRIAAGEVVERPASVIKELVENAIDAQATRIEIKIYDKECTKFHVADNGHGMTPDDMRMAVLRHATSKINTADDLDNLFTLGFRGEALPSIAAVSSMTITSRVTDSEYGYKINVKAGQVSLPEEAAANKGTVVLIEDLFFNTPARKKFLKTPRTEVGIISNIISEFVVAHPDIAFVFRHGNHRAIVSTGNGNRIQAVTAAFGQYISENLICIIEDDDLNNNKFCKVGGFVSYRGFKRPNRAHYHFYVNGRPASCKQLYSAIEEAYFTYIPDKTYPVVFLVLEIPPGDIDVNIHPSKLEIKLKNIEEIKDIVEQSIRTAIYKNVSALPDYNLELIPKTKVDALPTKPIKRIATTESYYKEDKGISSCEPVRLTQVDMFRALMQGKSDDNIYPTIDDEKLEATIRDISKKDLPKNKICYSDMRIIGQHLGTYVIAGLDRDLYLIDQHAAAERVLYEKMKKEMQDGETYTTMLAFPVNMSLSYEDHILITQYIIELRDFGFILEYFGDTTYVMRGIPMWYEESQMEKLFLTVLSILKEGKLDETKLRKEDLFKAACKKAIKANRYLSTHDISSIFEDLDKCDNSITCPHGRPIAICISEGEVRRRFLRSTP